MKVRAAGLTRLMVMVVAVQVATVAVRAQSLATPFDVDYVLEDLGPAAGVAGSYGGITFLYGDPDTLLVGGAANTTTGAIYRVSLVRDADGNITGFQGTATLHATAPLIDGGLAYGPGGVLLYSRYPDGEIGQILPGSASTDKVVALVPLGVTNSPGGLRTMPAGFPGAGELRLLSYAGALWYSAVLQADGSGTYDFTGTTLVTSLINSTEAFDFPAAGSPSFVDHGSMLVNEYRPGSIAAYDLDAAGNPLPSSRRPFVTGITRPEGMVFDPIRGDLLVSSFALRRIYVLRGFAPPCEQVADWSNYGSGWPGTLGIPELTCASGPVIGGSFDVTLGNSSGLDAATFILVGFQSATIPTGLGGDFALVPLSIIPAVIPAAGITLTATLPSNPSLCGVPVFAQLIQSDPGASDGFSFSPGLSLLLGS